MPQKRLRVTWGPLAGRVLWFEMDHAERELAAKRAVEVDDAEMQTIRYSDEELVLMGRAEPAEEDEEAPAPKPGTGRKTTRKGGTG